MTADPEFDRTVANPEARIGGWQKRPEWGDINRQALIDSIDQATAATLAASAALRDASTAIHQALQAAQIALAESRVALAESMTEPPAEKP